MDHTEIIKKMDTLQIDIQASIDKFIEETSCNPNVEIKNHLHMGGQSIEVMVRSSQLFL